MISIELHQSSQHKRRRQSKDNDDDGIDKDLVDKLRREGKRKREEYAERDAAAEVEKDMERELHEQQQRRQATKKATKESVEDRQVRLKWDRKKVKPSPSEDSLAKLFSEQFGPVESVELLGKKGNQALVTFDDPSSCKPCVDFYATSTEMRAKYVGKRKEDEEDDEEDDDLQQSQQQQHEESNRTRRGGTGGESLEQRRMRQAEERERVVT